tara:strand:+ start:288 stop:626 length:339 start_codon:yes stop_codon:yes gene_type:complete
MSLKLKISDIKLWDKLQEGSYTFPSGLYSDLEWPQPTLKMSIHPDWLKMMDDLEVGDVVTTHENYVGVITKIFDVTSLGMKKYQVLIGDKKEIYFSMSLKKIEDNNERSKPN